MFGRIIDMLMESVAGLLAFFYDTFYDLPLVGGSYGVAIIMMTVVIMIIMMPLTIKSTKSTIRMSQMQPKMKALQKKYKNDKQKLNAEIIALYKKEKISPLGGCLPMLAQMPVLLILFNVIRGITRRVGDMPYFGVASKTWSEYGSGEDPRTFFPKYLDESSQLYQDLRSSTSMKFGPLDLGNKPWDVLNDNYIQGLPYVALLFIVVATSFYQQYQIQSRRGSSSASINPQQKMIMRFLPFLSGIWGFVFPAGLVLYFATSNIFRIGQQSYITRSIYNKSSVLDVTAEEIEEEEVAIETTSSEPSAKSSESSREAAWAKRRNEKATSQAKNNTSKKKNSSRTTPKGTKSSGSKKNRKR